MANDISRQSHPLLIVDDDPIIRRLAGKAAARVGWTVMDARDGAEALQIIKSSEIGLVLLLDINMPRVDGLTLLRQVEGENCRAVVLTSDTDIRTVRKSFVAGAVDYFVKPVRDWSYLLSLLEKADLHLTLEEERSQRDALLAEKAEWEYWKDVFLSDAKKTEMEQVLDMLHIQFNQDQNYPLLAELFGAPGVDPRTTKVDSATIRMLRDGLSPVARFANGIGIAKRVTNSFPVFKTMVPDKVMAWLSELKTERLDRHILLRDHKFTFWVDEKVAEVDAYLHIDRDLMNVVVEELVINACKYCNEGDLIEFFVQTSSTSLQFMVTNPARFTTRQWNANLVEGIPKEMEALACKLFTRFSIDTTFRYEEQWPMGLGLPLAKQLIERHGGNLTIQNEHWHLGGGTEAEPVLKVCCRFDLPFVSSPVAEKEHAGAAVGQEDEIDGLEMF